MYQIMTIGYSTDMLGTFVMRVKEAGIRILLDIRKEGSGSSTDQRYKQGEVFRKSLEKYGIGYHALPEFANEYGGTAKGLRDYYEMLYLGVVDSRLPITDSDANPWRESTLGYSYSALRGMFYEFDAKSINAALMCCCGDWRKCHRSVLAKFLSEDIGVPVVHAEREV